MVIRLFEMFAGYGGASFALKKAGVPFKGVGYSEIKKAAIKCYEINHSGVPNYGDCTLIEPDKLPDFDLLCGGFPCQTFSMAGKRAGFEDARGTLFNEIIRIASIKKPKFMLLENVEGLLIHDDRNSLRVIVHAIEKAGYYVIYKVLDSSEYGTPQTRRRLFFICRYSRPWGFNEFKWPEYFSFKRLSAVLENDVSINYAVPLKTLKAAEKINWNNYWSNMLGLDSASCPTLICGACNQILFKTETGVIRNLTPKECFRL